DSPPQVDLHQVFVPVQVLGLHLAEQRVGRHAGVVDQRVDAAELLQRLVDQRAALCFLGDVHGHAQGLGAVFTALGGDGVELLLAAPGQHQRGLRAVLGGQLAGDLGAYAVGAAGDEGDV